MSMDFIVIYLNETQGCRMTIYWETTKQDLNDNANGANGHIYFLETIATEEEWTLN